MILSSFGHSSRRTAHSPLPATNRGVSGSTEGEFMHLHTSLANPLRFDSPGSSSLVGLLFEVRLVVWCIVSCR